MTKEEPQEQSHRRSRATQEPPKDDKMKMGEKREEVRKDAEAQQEVTMSDDEMDFRANLSPELLHSFRKDDEQRAKQEEEERKTREETKEERKDEVKMKAKDETDVKESKGAKHEDKKAKHEEKYEEVKEERKSREETKEERNDEVKTNEKRGPKDAEEER